MFIQKVFLGPTGDPPLSDLSRTDVLFKLSPICPSYLFNYSTILCTGHVVIYNTRFWYSRCGSYNILHIHTVNTIVYSMIKQHTIGYIMIIHEIRHHPQLYWFLEWNFFQSLLCFFWLLSGQSYPPRNSTFPLVNCQSVQIFPGNIGKLWIHRCLHHFQKQQL